MAINLMLEFFPYVIYCVGLYAVGHFLSSILVKRVKNIQEEHEREEQELLELLMEKVKPVSIEKHDDIYYWFDSRTQNFLAQGTSMQTSIEHLRSRFPTEIFLVSINGIVYQISAPDWIPRKTLEVVDK